MDDEVEQRGHRLVRHVDDSAVWVESEAAGERATASPERSLEERLRLQVDRDEIAVARPWARQFLGYGVAVDRKTKPKVASQSIQRLKTELRASSGDIEGGTSVESFGSLAPRCGLAWRTSGRAR